MRRVWPTTGARLEQRDDCIEIFVPRRILSELQTCIPRFWTESPVLAHLLIPWICLLKKSKISKIFVSSMKLTYWNRPWNTESSSNGPELTWPRCKPLSLLQWHTSHPWLTLTPQSILAARIFWLLHTFSKISATLLKVFDSNRGIWLSFLRVAAPSWKKPVRSWAKNTASHIDRKLQATISTKCRSKNS